MNNLLEIKDLCISYDGQRALKNINLDIGKREIISIVGESGSGKTTLLNSIIHMLNANAVVESGEINFEGANLSNLTEKQWREIRGNTIGMIFQNAKSFLNPIRKIGKQFEDILCEHRKINKIKAREIATEWLMKMGFNDPNRILSSYAFELSGGMNQRVAIAMCLVMEPEMILADEPTSALDVVSQSQVMEELKYIRETYDTTIVMVTHNIGCAAYISDRIVVMNNGEIEEYGVTEDVILRPSRDYTKKLLNAIPELKGYCQEDTSEKQDVGCGFAAV